MAEIESRPPFQRDEARNAYIGVRLRQMGALTSVRKLSDDLVRVCVKTRGPSYLWFNTSLTDYPEFKFLHEGAPLLVEGIIAVVERAGPIMELKEVAVVFMGDKAN